MKARECVIWCSCGKGAMSMTSLRSTDGMHVAFWITEDEFIYFRGYCCKCGTELEFKYSIMELLFECKPNREVQ